MSKTVKKSHPAFSAMIAKAIAEQGERTGSSRQAIEKHIQTNHKIDLGLQQFRAFLNRALRKGLESGDLVASKGKYRLSVKAKGPMKKAAAAVKKTPVAPKAKPAASAKKKPAAAAAEKKKPAAKKAAPAPAPKAKTMAKAPAKKKAPAAKPVAKKAAMPRKTTVGKKAPAPVKKAAAPRKAPTARKAPTTRKAPATTRTTRQSKA